MIKLKSILKEWFLLSFYFTLFLNIRFPLTNNFTSYSFDGFIRWKLETEADDFFDSSARVADLDGDGLLEIIVCSLESNVFCLDYTGKVLWTFETESQISSSTSVVDIDGDGKLEVLVTDIGNFLYCLNNKGKELWRFPLFSIISSPCIADVDGDEKLEIIVTEDDRYNHDHSNIYCLTYTGGIKWQQAVRGIILRSVSVANFDSDDTLEVLVSSSDKLYCLNYQGEVEWSYTTTDWIRSASSIIDLDGDNTPEILFSSSDGVFCINSSGGEEWYFYTVNSTSFPVVTDLDGDNELEVVFSSITHKLFCLNYQGIEKWDLTLDEYMSSPALVDLNDDGKLEIIGGTRGGTLYIISCNGTVEWSHNFTDMYFDGSPCVVDLDGDGVFEILIGVNIGYGYPAFFYCFSFSGISSSGVSPWYCFKGSNYNTGNIDSDSDFIDDLTESFYHTNKTNSDTDNDGFLDGLEVQIGLNPLVDDSGEDQDNDGLTNFEELKIYHTSIFTADTDRDGRKDGTEIRLGTDPLKWDNWVFLFGLYFLPLYGSIVTTVALLVKFKLKRSGKGAS
ncbi:MAG: FG-GAP-like repeat-containing protein [Candidatus Heimdallarchaeaceae archaeon]